VSDTPTSDDGVDEPVITPDDPIEALRVVWDALHREGLKQVEVAAEAERLRAALPDLELGSVKPAYLSQLVGKKAKEEKQPTTKVIRAITLALCTLTDRRRTDLSKDRARTVGIHLERLRTKLELPEVRWADRIGGPFPPDALNALKREGEVRAKTVLAEGRGISISVTGGPQVGKSTLLLYIAAEAERLGFRVVAVDLSLVITPGTTEGELWRHLGQAVLRELTPDVFAFEEALERRLAADAAPLLLVVESANLLFDHGRSGGRAMDWAARAGLTFFKHFPDHQKTYGASSPWHRYNVAGALTFDASLLPQPSVSSSYFRSDLILEVQPLSNVETRDLLALHLAHAGADVSVPPPADPDALADLSAGKRRAAEAARRDDVVEATASAICAYFGGQPMLVQDFLSRWVTDPVTGDDLERRLVDDRSRERDRFLRHRARQVERSDGLTEQVFTAGGNATPVRADADALVALGLVDSRMVWQAPYLERELAPVLAQQEGGRSRGG